MSIQQSVKLQPPVGKQVAFKGKFADAVGSLALKAGGFGQTASKNVSKPGILGKIKNNLISAVLACLPDFKIRMR
ncbi:MAG: hypothetical protein WCG23_10090 [bacterium]